MIKLVDRYVGRTALTAVLGVWVALTLLMSLFTMLDQLGDASPGTGLGDIVWFVALKSVNAAYVVFPVSALLGALIGVGGLAAGNELVAFRTAGVSRLRLSGSVLGAVGLLTLLVMAMGEWALPMAEQQARWLRDGQVDAGAVGGNERDLWIRDGSGFIHIGRSVVYPEDVTPEVTLHNVVQYTFDENYELRQVDRAGSAEYDGREWRLVRNTRVSIDEDRVRRQFDTDLPWPVSFEPEMLTATIVRPRYMSLRAIVDQLRYLNQNGLDSRAYDSVFWAKVLFPLTVLALVLAGMPFLFGSARTHSLGLRIFIGMSLGGVFMIVSKTLQNFSEAYALPSAVGVALPSLALAVVVVLILRRSV